MGELLSEGRETRCRLCSGGADGVLAWKTRSRYVSSMPTHRLSHLFAKLICVSLRMTIPHGLVLCFGVTFFNIWNLRLLFLLFHLLILFIMFIRFVLLYYRHSSGILFYLSTDLRMDGSQTAGRSLWWSGGRAAYGWRSLSHGGIRVRSRDGSPVR